MSNNFIITVTSLLYRYGTDSQIEFFKMLDKKIEEVYILSFLLQYQEGDSINITFSQGPDFHEESDSDERT